MNSSSPMAGSTSSLDDLCVNTLRFLSVDAVQKANSGHPGLPLGRRADGLRALDPIPQTQSGQSRLVRPRSLCSLRGTRIDASV